MDELVTRSKIAAFRCDASLGIGSGHVMRCLTLADAMSDAGWECHFLCRDLPGNLIGSIARHGHQAHTLSAPPAGMKTTVDASYAAWLGVTPEQDAAECRSVLEKIAPDRVVVDHYALDADWEEAAVPFGVPVMAIDDLADRRHRCDLLLDQNLGRQAGHYDGLVPGTAARLIGPGYALLRPEFARLRSQSMARRDHPRLGHILVSMGGMDSRDVTGQIMKVLAGARLPEDCRITIVMGGSAPFVERVRALAATMPRPTRVVVDSRHMAELMADADLAIGAAGSTSWERCCLGLPTLLLVLADNQAPAARALDEVGAAKLLGDGRQEGWRELLSHTTMQFSDAGKLAAMSRQAAKLVDGLGAVRCRSIITGRLST